MGNFKNLAIAIEEAAKHYYKGNPILTDLDFDNLLDELRNNSPDHPILKAVGFGYMPEPGDKKVSHIGDTVGSLDKIKIADIKRSSNLYNNDIVTMPKLDGSSIVCHYRNGLLDKILTRGNGIYGIDVTKNLYHIMPSQIDNYGNELLVIRGECVITDEDFENIEGSNSRNKCAGMIQSKGKYSIGELSFITFVPYSIITCDNFSHNKFLHSKESQLNYLKDMGFNQIPYSMADFKYVYENILNKTYAPEWMQKLPNGKTFPIDGVVICYNDIDNKPFSVDGKSYSALNPTYSIAFKYADKTKKTIVEGINWQMSNGGKYVPVLKVKECVIDGIKINNITANNYQWLLNRKCGIGSEVEIKRANEVIPQIHSVLKESENFNIPLKCEICDSNLTIHGTDLICDEPSCPQKEVGLLYKVWEFIKPDGASDACFDIFFTEYVMEYKEDILSNGLYLLQMGDLPTSKNHYHQLIKQAILNFRSMKVDLPDIIKMANIPTLGRRIGDRIKETICLEYFIDIITNENLFSSNVFKFAVMNDDINRKKLKFLVYLWRDRFVSDNDEPTKEKLKVAATGAMSISRSKWFKEFDDYVEKVSVGKSCQYLICNEKSTSSSYKKAEKLGIPIVTEEEFMKIIGR